jgi:hypothetical protein
VLPAILVLIALGLLGFAGHKISEGRDRVETDVARIDVRNDAGSSRYPCKYSFELDGERYEGWSRCDGEDTVGKLVEVHYEPGSPDSHTIADPARSGWSTAAFAFAGAMMALGFAWSLGTPTRAASHRPDTPPPGTEGVEESLERLRRAAESGTGAATARRSRIREAGMWIPFGAAALALVGGTIVYMWGGSGTTQLPPAEAPGEALEDADTSAAYERRQEALEILERLEPPAAWQLDEPVVGEPELRDEGGVSSSAVTLTHATSADIAVEDLRDWLASYPKLVPADGIECSEDPPACSYQGPEPGNTELEVLVRVSFINDERVDLVAGTRKSE